MLLRIGVLITNNILGTLGLSLPYPMGNEGALERANIRFFNSLSKFLLLYYNPSFVII
jgi:hypothetical protein